jgi:hypothetical protein
VDAIPGCRIDRGLWWTWDVELLGLGDKVVNADVHEEAVLGSWRLGNIVKIYIIEVPQLHDPLAHSRLGDNLGEPLIDVHRSITAQLSRN